MKFTDSYDFRWSCVFWTSWHLEFDWYRYSSAISVYFPLTTCTFLGLFLFYLGNQLLSLLWADNFENFVTHPVWGVKTLKLKTNQSESLKQALNRSAIFSNVSRNHNSSNFSNVPLKNRAFLVKTWNTCLHRLGIVLLLFTKISRLELSIFLWSERRLI